MTKELYEKLKPYEDKLYTATYCGFVRLTDSSMKSQLAVLHNEEFGNNGNILTGCNRCVINALKNLGKSYFAFKEQYEKSKEVDKEPEPNSEVIENEEVIKPKPKRATNKTKKIKE